MRSASRTPVHSAQPTPPLPHWLPAACGPNERPLPPHSSTRRRVTGRNLALSSPSVSSSLLLTSPSTVSFQALGSLAGSGSWPLSRTKNLSVGVVSSSSRCSGVSATSGRSPSTPLVALAGEAQVLRPLRRALGVCGRDQGRDAAGRHVLGARDGATDRGAHGCESAAAEEAAAARPGAASERDRVGALGIIPVEFIERAFGARHGIPPWSFFL